MSWVDRFVRYEPRAGVEYTGVLVVDDPKRTPLRAMALGIGGSMLALIGFIWLAAMVTAGLAWAFWTASGQPGTFLDYYSGAVVTFASPLGMVAAHLGLAAAIPLTMALVLFVHRFHPRWLHSVQPGFRWRYALVATLAALVILGGLWALSRAGQPWTFAPENQYWGFWVAILVTAPLQAAGEEYLFRGYLLQALYSAAPNLNRPIMTSQESGTGAAKVTWSVARGYQRWFGIIGSALLFAILHGGQDLPLFLHRFTFGLIAGWLVMKTGGLEAGIAAHVVNNVVAFGYANISGTMVATRTVTTASWAELAWNLAGFAVFAVAAIWISRRMNLSTRTPASSLAGGSRL
jgi:membrane protease YdiL (CAAX protease family)